MNIGHEGMDPYPSDGQATNPKELDDKIAEPVT